MTDRIGKMYCYYPAAEHWCSLGILDHHWLRSFRNEFKISAKNAVAPGTYLFFGNWSVFELNSFHWRVFTKISLDTWSFCVLLNTPKKFPVSNSSVGVWYVPTHPYCCLRSLNLGLVEKIVSIEGSALVNPHWGSVPSLLQRTNLVFHCCVGLVIVRIYRNHDTH